MVVTLRDQRVGIIKRSINTEMLLNFTGNSDLNLKSMCNRKKGELKAKV